MEPSRVTLSIGCPESGPWPPVDEEPLEEFHPEDATTVLALVHQGVLSVWAMETTERDSQ